jgi:hypothetical protein
MRQLPLFPPEIALENGRLHGPLPPDAPIIVSNGVGVDSQINLKQIRGLWGHGERMTEYIVRRGLLPGGLLAVVFSFVPFLVLVLPVLLNPGDATFLRR